MSSVFWGQLMEQVAGVLRTEKGAAMVLLLVGFLAYQGFTWAANEHENMVSKGEFAQFKTEVKDGFESGEINDASQMIRLLKIDLRIAQATGASDHEILKMKADIASAKAYKMCLVKRDPNCEHLKDPE